MRRAAWLSALGRKRARARWRAWQPSPPDADTLRWRSLDAARGQIVREGHTYRAGGVTHWLVIRSRVGRTNQLDVIVDGRLWRTAGPRRIAAWLKRSRPEIAT